MKTDIHDLCLVLDSGIPLVVIESYEEPRVLQMMTRLAIKRQLALFSWSITTGMQRLGFGIDLDQDQGFDKPEAALQLIKQSPEPGLYVLCDFHPYLVDEPKNIRLLKEIALQYDKLKHTVVFLSHRLELPPELKRYGAHFELALPSDDQLLNIVREEAANWSNKHRGQKVKTDNKTLKKLVANLRGLSAGEARQLARSVIFDGGAITVDDLPEVNKAKFTLMDMEGILSFEYDTAKFSEVGGLENFKQWLRDRQKAFLEDDKALDPPKGVMLLGIQGSGKSLAAKAVAGVWGVPLLRLDFGALYNKYFGETERNLREALKLADLMSPCVLWMDEIEKGIATGLNDQGTSRRVLGTLLTWMAERTTKVFIVATSNDISQLPPELVRKGRMDEIFFVDLPDAKIRRTIFEIHLSKRDQDCQEFDIEMLANITEGFSGAEIEQAVVGAFYSAAAEQQQLQMHHLVAAIKATSPLSVVMAEDVQYLREWANNRTVLAN
ncbi:AAA family ATPase [Spartinivicinus ruber]|uniref:AAA family ATPase n=1 Tax=Spartinivicinus ruber TaxID=2683272 RepID=UPI001E556A4C|nr:AAA family ATPase [Spartinivicinus ruber]